MMSASIGVLLASLVNAFLGLGITSELVLLSACVGVSRAESVHNPTLGE